MIDSVEDPDSVGQDESGDSIENSIGKRWNIDRCCLYIETSNKVNVD